MRALVCPIFKNTKSYNPIPWRTFQVEVEKRQSDREVLKFPRGVLNLLAIRKKPHLRRDGVQFGVAKSLLTGQYRPESPTPSTRTRTLRHELSHDDSGLHPKCLTTVRTTEEFGVGGSAFLA